MSCSSPFLADPCPLHEHQTQLELISGHPIQEVAEVLWLEIIFAMHFCLLNVLQQNPSMQRTAVHVLRVVANRHYCLLFTWEHKLSRDQLSVLFIKNPTVSVLPQSLQILQIISFCTQGFSGQDSASSSASTLGSRFEFLKLLNQEEEKSWKHFFECWEFDTEGSGKNLSFTSGWQFVQGGRITSNLQADNIFYDPTYHKAWNL